MKKHLYINISANYNTLPTCKPYRTRRLCVRVFAISWPTIMPKTLTATLYEGHFIRTFHGLAYALQVLRTRATRRYHMNLDIMLWSHETYGGPVPIGLSGRPYGPVALGNSVWHHPPPTGMVACIQAFYGFSVCFKHRISITRACTLCFHKGHVHVYFIWARADAIRVLEHLYA